MTVLQLKKALENMPDNMDVFIKQSDEDFIHSLSMSVEKKFIKFSDGEVSANAEVVIISDEN